MKNVTVSLRPAMFGDREQTIAASGEFTVNAFTYSTGVAALRVTNAAGHFISLPFQGQQVWRAFFLNRELTMRTTFPEPVPTSDYLATYGGFLLHCGASAMGNPGNDSHPLHGELPNIRYDDAYVTLGSDERGDYAAVGGTVEVRTGFSMHYTFSPEVRLYAGASVMDVNCALHNKRSSPLDYMYLCHINFAPVNGARLIYSAKPGDVKVFIDVPDTLPAEHQHKLRTYMEAVAADPALHDAVGAPGQVYDPEIVFDINYAADADGYAHCMQLVDGSADYACFRAAELPHGIRWISRTGDEDAMGMILPATADHKGRAEAARRGMLKVLAPGASAEFRMKAGALAPTDAAAMKNHIESIVVKK